MTAGFVTRTVARLTPNRSRMASATSIASGSMSEYVRADETSRTIRATAT